MRNIGNKGITLIALVITIIVLLILAGISIASLTGSNGILTKAGQSKEESKRAEYGETLKLMLMDLKTEKIIDNLSTQEFMNRLQDKIEKNDIFNGVKEIKKSGDVIAIVTEEDYIFVVSENDVNDLGTLKEGVPPDLNESNVEFGFSTEDEWTNSDIFVTIKPKVEGYLVEYSTDQTNWKIYSSAVVMKENGTLYTRLVNLSEQAGGVTETQVEKIDKEAPEGSIEAIPIKKTIQVTITANDVEATDKNACSEIKGYYYSKDGGNTYTEMQTEATYTFEELEHGTSYDIFVKIMDNAGNVTILNTSVETIVPRYIIQNGNQLITGVKYAGSNSGSSVWNDTTNGYVGCHLYGQGRWATVAYWTVPNVKKGSTVCFQVDAPWISIDDFTQDAGGRVFINHSVPVITEMSDYISGEISKEIRGNDGGFFEGARYYEVTATQEGTLYVGIHKYLRRKL